MKLSGVVGINRLMVIIYISKTYCYKENFKVICEKTCISLNTCRTYSCLLGTGDTVTYLLPPFLPPTLLSTFYLLPPFLPPTSYFPFYLLFYLLPPTFLSTFYLPPTSYLTFYFLLPFLPHTSLSNSYLPYHLLPLTSLSTSYLPFYLLPPTSFSTSYLPFYLLPPFLAPTFLSTSSFYLTPVEKSAISLICPIIAIYKIGRSQASRGHVLPRIPQ